MTVKQPDTRATAGVAARAKAKLLREVADEVEAFAEAARRQAEEAVQKALAKATTYEEQMQANHAGSLSQAAEAAYWRVAQLLRDRATKEGKKTLT